MALPTPAPTYCGMPLTRGGALRDDPDWIRRQLDRADARILPLWRDRNLLRHQRNGPAACFIEMHALRTAPSQDAWSEVIVHHATELIYLGHAPDAQRSAPVFAADLTDHAEDRVNALAAAIAADAAFIDLRAVGPALAADEAATMAYARGVTHWHRRNRHCSRCGSPAHSRRGGHMRQCADAACGQELFPRIDPAVIMLVEQRAPRDGVPKCLLGRNRSVPRRVYSTLAGYVDPGESLEEAVAREVHEETGVVIDSAAYRASQPWPFPGCLMIGFRAAAREQPIVLAADELEDAQWFSAAEVRAFVEYDAADADAIALPRRDSIARTLVDDWLREQPR